MHKDEAGTSFERLDYPANSVPESVQQRMIRVMDRRVMEMTTAVEHLEHLERPAYLNRILALRSESYAFLKAIQLPFQLGTISVQVLAGMVLLANASDDFITDYMRRPLKRYTPKTICEPDELLATLATGRCPVPGSAPPTSPPGRRSGPEPATCGCRPRA